VAEELLYFTDIDTSLEKFNGGGIAEAVRVSVCNLRLDEDFFQVI
jgi:hypothetical protein